ncbi:MAG: FG-GAP repeat protein [Chloroflexota bacterium]
MNFNRIHLRWLLPLLLVVLLAGGVGLFAWWRAAAAPQADRAPALAAQDSLWAQIAEAEYIYTWHEPSAAWLAANPAQGWHTAFGAGGLRLEPSGGQGWHFGLRLSAWGRADALQAVEGVPPAAEKEGVRYTRPAGLVEWYVNDSRGIEQGFDLAAAPSAGSGALVLEMAVDTDLAASLTSEGLAVTFSRAGEAVLRYADLLVQDATGASLPAHIELAGAGTIRLVVDDSRAQYPITVDPLIASLQADLVVPDGVAFDRLGASVALDGDILVIGAAQADVGANLDQGVVYVFQSDGADDKATWTLTQKITPSDGAAYDEFGSSLALDGSTLLVGAPCADTCRGAVYVFTPRYDGGSSLFQQARLAASDGAAYDRFGASVALDGNMALVGAPLQADGRGAAYLFTYATTWNQANKLFAGDGLAGDRFGVAVALDGGLALVGADGAENGNVYEHGFDDFGRDSHDLSSL